ncbi:MAG: hypothetical protein NXH89_00860 [Cyclobacteriaceae bacterium]|jgi:hypothetical protein|uniref:Uncharacterized protein n=2 Tax=Algoriphagus marincola TaxID=264027 RepID=A0ABS7N7M4_9BACT|nr:hypothetical protein [Algoriphagus marincola]MBY5952333.1 hypothetical protein [Algoriphagus marincola]MCR9080942.1 hypothetical protein [Cyclobacteriaceae bacterium]
MKKMILTLGLLVFSFVGFACSGTWFACGGQDVADMIEDAGNNCDDGDQFTILDLCHPDGIHTIYVTVGTIAGPGGGGL